MKSKKYVSIDIETTGLNPATCQILEIGAVIDDWVTPLEALPKFHCYVIHDLIQGEPYALQMNQGILEKIAKKKQFEKDYSFLYAAQVAQELATFFAKYEIPLQRIPCAGKNFASFDRMFLERLPNWPLHLKVNHRSYDPSMLYWNPYEDEGIPDTKKCMERAGITGEVAHTAVEDALVVIQLFRHVVEERFHAVH